MARRTRLGTPLSCRDPLVTQRIDRNRRRLWLWRHGEWHGSRRAACDCQKADLVRHCGSGASGVQPSAQGRESDDGRWHSGTNLVDRLLGKELCVLAWAAETATAEQLPIVCSKWAALRPEERWWLFAMTVAEAGLPEDTQRGWRRALFHALSDGEKPDPGKKRRRPTERTLMPLFKDVE